MNHRPSQPHSPAARWSLATIAAVVVAVGLFVVADAALAAHADAATGSATVAPAAPAHAGHALADRAADRRTVPHIVAARTLPTGELRVRITTRTTPLTLHACRYEDSANCWWNASSSGNSRGHSFIALWNGHGPVCLAYLTPAYAAAHDGCGPDHADDDTDGAGE